MPFESVLDVSLSIPEMAETPSIAATDARMPSKTLLDGNATDCFWRARNWASVSTACPRAAAAGLETVCHPSVGVMIFVTVPGKASMAPSFEQIAVTVISPCGGITTVSGNFQRLPFSSSTIPPEMVDPACPMHLRSTLEKLALFRLMPFVLTILDNAAPLAVEGAYPV